MLPILSLIMPAYNAENTCERALVSALPKTYEIEIIIVDDGSTDNTYGKCLAIQKKDQRVKLIRQKNQGVSAARNAGLNIASGEYVGFIDSDDELAENYFDVLIPLLKEKLDVVIFGYSAIRGGKRIFGVKSQCESSPSALFEDLLFHGGCLNSPWNKLFKNSLLQIRFNTEKSMGEDLEFCCKYLADIKTCKVIPDELYLYNIDSEGSLTKKLDIVTASLVSDMQVLMEFAKNIGFEKKIIDDKFFQRLEGILGTAETQEAMVHALHALDMSIGYTELFSSLKPRKIKNKIVKLLLSKHMISLLWIYLSLKKVLRRWKHCVGIQ